MNHSKCPNGLLCDMCDCNQEDTTEDVDKCVYQVGAGCKLVVCECREKGYSNVKDNVPEQKFKADRGKPQHSLLERGFPRALGLMQATLDYGAKKYEAHSWRKVPDAMRRYDEAARRHRRDRDMERDFMCKDAESGLPHVAHELCNLMAQIELYFQQEPSKAHLDKLYKELCTYNEPPQEHKQ